MAVTKTHPIKSTLKKAIDYICNPAKTDGKLLVSSFGCAAETADIEFAWTRRHSIDKGTHLGRHLIQAFDPGETTPEQAHEIGMQLAKEILGGKYEFVLTTHIDKGQVLSFKRCFQHTSYFFSATAPSATANRLRRNDSATSQEIIGKERQNHERTNLHPRRRLLSAEPKTLRPAGRTSTRTLRHDAQGVPVDRETRAVRISVALRKALSTMPRDR